MVDNLVSVIIPFHNRLAFLHEAIMSVAEQTYRPIELVLVDDCSGDPFSADQYHDIGLPVVYIRNSTNVGPAMSRFHGLDRCNGDYVVFLDSDDLLGSTFIERQVSTLKKSDDAIFAYCFTKEFSKDGIQGDRRGSQKCIDRVLPEIILEGRIWCTSSCLWSKKYLSSVDRFGGYSWEDYRLDISASLLRNVVACTPEYLCYYRVGSDDKLSASGDGHQAKQLYSIDGILRTLGKAHHSFPQFDCVVDKVASKYLSCLIAISEDPGISQVCSDASKIMMFSWEVRWLLLLSSVIPGRLRLIMLRMAKRILRKARFKSCHQS